MSYLVACLDMDLQEFVSWIKDNIRPGFEPRFISVESPDLWPGLPEADFMVLFESEITAEMIATAPKLKLIQLPQVGYDNVDVAAAAKAGVAVCNTPGVTAGSVAEHTLMLILATLRRLLECDASVRRSEWPQLEMFRRGLHDLAGATVGIVGFGNTGRALARICCPLAGEVLYYKRHRLPGDEEQQLGVAYAHLDDLLGRSDIVSLHVPLNEGTRGLIGGRELSLMKPGAILINAARGPVVDYEALIEHMHAGRLSGAGFDVLWQEPLPSDSPLLSFDNVVFSPHVASSSQEAAWDCFRVAFDNVYRVAAGEEPLHRVA
jgi:phosphoglycerate dehydrogenase-like enzyme